MVKIDIPGFGKVNLKYLVADFSGTLSIDGRILPSLKERLNKISNSIKIHILTADTHGRARDELREIRAQIQFLSPGLPEDNQKEAYIRELGGDNVFAVGNGNNDWKMLKAARIGVAVCLAEGCASETVKAADIMVLRAEDALDLLLNPARLRATLRF